MLDSKNHCKVFFLLLLSLPILCLDYVLIVKFLQASDYQKPFDGTSEKLLRALLEKRKKLNPSYLRLMARYVGLGLLKSPVKSSKD